MTKVLLDEFAAVVRLGLADVLTEAGCEVVADDERPDVVIVDLTQPGRRAQARQLSLEHPGVTVIALAAGGPIMQVFPPCHLGESYRAILNPAELVLATIGRPIA